MQSRIPARTATLTALSLLATLGLTPCSAATILFDVGFNPDSSGYITGPDSSGRHWNSVKTWAVTPSGGSSAFPSNAVDTQGNATGIAWVTTDAFVFYTTAGDTTNTLYPDAATMDALQVTSGDVGEVRLEGFAPGSEYNFTFYGSTSSTNREAIYTILDPNGDGSVLDATSVNLITTGNVDNTVSINNVIANASGEVLFRVGSPVGKGSGELNVLEIRPVPEPAAAMLVGAGSLLMLRRRRAG